MRTPGSRAGLAPLIVLCAAQLMVLLDGTIVNIALPTIARELGLAFDTAAWLMTGYYLAFGGLLLLGGRAGDLLGRRTMLLGGVALFTVASIVGGFAGGAAVLITTRVLQGLGAAAAAPSVLALINTTYPEAKARARALAVYAAMSGLGAATGLIAGGVLTEWLSWRWVFFVNVPLGLAVACLTPALLRETPRGTGRFDAAGATLVSAGLAVAVYGFSRAQTHGWGDRTVVICLSVAVALLAGFGWVEARTPRPLLPLRLLADRRRSVALVATAGVGAVLFVLFYYGSQYAQNVLHASPLVAGLQFVPFSATLLVTSQVVARTVGRVRPERIVATGAALAAAAMLWLSKVEPGSTYSGAMLGPILGCAVGVGLMMVPLTLTATARLAPADAGVGAGLLATMQQIGGTVGIAVSATLASHATENRLRDGLPARETHAQLIGQALTDGYRQAFVAAACVFAVVVVVTAIGLRAPRPIAEAVETKAADPAGRSDLARV